jgi:Holliday junction resolvase RusA-like endonuclease
MRLVTRFEVFGRCVPWSMPDPVITKGGKRKFVLKDPALTAWQEHVADAARVAMFAEPIVLGPVMLSIEFYRATPYGSTPGDWWSVNVEERGGRFVKPGRPQPDLTNLLKGTEDAIAGVVFGNDAQVCEIRTTRVYGPQDGVRITVHALEPGDRPASA